MVGKKCINPLILPKIEAIGSFQMSSIYNVDQSTKVDFSPKITIFFFKIHCEISKYINKQKCRLSENSTNKSRETLIPN